MTVSRIAIQRMNIKIKERNSLLDKRDHLDMIIIIWTAWRNRVAGNDERRLKA